MTGYCDCARYFPWLRVPEGARYHYLCERPIKDDGNIWSRSGGAS